MAEQLGNVEEGECSSGGEDEDIGEYTPLERPVQVKPALHRLPATGEQFFPMADSFV